MAYTTINKPTDYFNTVTWTGTNDATTSVTGVNFKPDLVWIKNRNVADDHVVHDGIRGVTKQLFTSSNGSEQTNSEGIQSFDTDGFTTGTHRSTGGDSGNGMVSWNWLGANGTASNTDGSITSTVSANTTSGFSIVSYTGNGTAGATIGHGLGTAPKVVLIKRRSASGEWIMGHGSLGFTKFLELNLTGGAQTSTLRFNDTAPTNQVFTVGSTADTNQNGTTLIAYCFAEKTGYSKFGSYTGNGNADGTFVYTGFKPAFLMVKKFTEAGNSWVMLDTARSDVPNANVNDQRLYADHSSSEASSPTRAMDLVSNGFKIRGDGGDVNNNSQQYIYMCFASEPLVGDNPATAR